MAFNGPSGAKYCHLSPLLVVIKAFFDSLSIDRGVEGAFVGCFAIASIINLYFFFPWSHREGVQRQFVVDSASESTLGEREKGKTTLES